MIDLIANSHKQGIPVVGTMHRARNEADARTIRAAIKNNSFYYPTDLGRFLFSCGIETIIHAHSGRIVINGEYV